MKYLMEYDLINKSPLAPITGVYRYELIPAEQPMDYYIDLWYLYGLGDNETLLASMEDTVYLEEGDSLRIWASQSGLLQYLVSYEVMS